MLDLLDWAKKFIEVPSVSRDGNAAIARTAAELLREVGLEPRLVSEHHDGQEQFLLIADLPARSSSDTGETGAGSVVSGHAGEAAPGLILLTHLDTVPPGDFAAWTETGGDPFLPTVEGDRLYGLGSADAKVDLVCKAAALEGLEHGRLRRPIRVVGTYAEEIGLVGARSFATNGGTEGFGFALVGEPSELVGIRAHKGYSVFEIRIGLEPIAAGGSGEQGSVRQECFEGRSAHSSTPHLGTNAIERALERLSAADVRGLCCFDGGGAVNMVPALAELTLKLDPAGAVRPAAAAGSRPVEPAPGTRFYDPAPLVDFHAEWTRTLEQLEATVDRDFDPSHTVGNLGSVRLSDGSVALRFDLRPVPGVDPMDVVKPLARLGRVELVRSNPALAAPADGRLIRHLTRAQQAAGLEPRVATKATCTEAGLLAERGLEVLVVGAGISVGNVHRPNEYTKISQLFQARDMYRALIEGLCTEAE